MHFLLSEEKDRKNSKFRSNAANNKTCCCDYGDGDDVDDDGGIETEPERMAIASSYQPFAWYSWSPASKKSLLKLEAGCCDMATGSGCCFSFVMSCVVCRRFKALRLPLLRC